ncbi:hypothetical protein CYMTET_39956 [Cymbomonas tetramitiformis]|uniref:Uncharacterized protein n=1 Tax=Cymbomonas tetramitiformis TaxID=36881 RepID=A0AAE0F536_9CHLO|nr:hypothetical protein CYMTET_39956 [Cymbomonas tetramitiformis]
MLPQLTADQRDRLHRKIVLWLTVVDIVVALSVEGKIKVKRALQELAQEGILPSIGGDIWSQGGIAIFGILVYWIDSNFQYQERLVSAIPFSAVRHSGAKLQEATKKACATMGIGVLSEVLHTAGEWEEEEPSMVDTVADSIHCTVSDNAANIVNAWNCFDGFECTDHTVALGVKAFLEQHRVKKVFAKLRGMTGHFNHSIIGVKLLNECQKRNNLAETKPPQDNDTRYRNIQVH